MLSLSIVMAGDSPYVQANNRVFVSMITWTSLTRQRGSVLLGNPLNLRFRVQGLGLTQGFRAGLSILLLGRSVKGASGHPSVRAPGFGV